MASPFCPRASSRMTTRTPFMTGFFFSSSAPTVALAPTADIGTAFCASTSASRPRPRLNMPPRPRCRAGAGATGDGAAGAVSAAGV